MMGKTFEDEVRELSKFLGQISIEDWLVCDIQEAVDYAHKQGLEVYQLSDDEKRMFIRYDMARRGAI